MSAADRVTAGEVVTALRGALESLFGEPNGMPPETRLSMKPADARELLVTLDSTMLVAAFLIEEAAVRHEPLNDAARRTLRKCAATIGHCRDRVAAAVVPHRAEFSAPVPKVSNGVR